MRIFPFLLRVILMLFTYDTNFQLNCPFHLKEQILGFILFNDLQIVDYLNDV